MNKVKQLTVFLSCPGDVLQERQRAEEIITAFSNEYKDQGIIFDVIHSGKLVSEFGSAPQEIINNQLPPYDLYIGIMGGRFGTKTEKYGSGTEEEFEIALQKKTTDSALHVSFLFKHIDIAAHDLSEDDLVQYLKVRQFKNKISDTGFFGDFKTTDEFTNKIRAILKKCANTHSQEVSQSALQIEMLAENSIHDGFPINPDFYASFLNSVGVEITNNHKSGITLEDVYIALDMNVINENAEETGDFIDEKIVSTSCIDCSDEDSPDKFIVAGDESAGKTSFCKKVFLNAYKRGLVPVYLHGSEIRNANLESVLKLIYNKVFVEQYSASATDRFKALSPKKRFLIIDDYEDTKINDRYKIRLLKDLEEHFGKILVTAEPIFLFNANVSIPDEFSNIAHFQAYKLKDMGHKLRDALIRKWIVAGREDKISEEEVFTTAENYRHIIDNILGANFVPKKPFIILVLLQAIQGGSANNLAHSSFVRYYRYLIDTTLLSNLSQSKIEVYYSFLPELAYALFLNDRKGVDKDAFMKLVKDFCNRKGIYEDDVVDAKSNLLSLDFLVLDDDGFKFKHCYGYYYFLAQYLSDNLHKPEIRDIVVKICRSLNLKENANIIVFLSYHTDDQIIIESITSVIDSLFKDIELFEFTNKPASSLNKLVSEGPKIMLSHEAHTERTKALEARDRADNHHRAINEIEDEGNALDFAAQMNLAFRSVEIVGQLLKNHFATLEAEPKKKLFSNAVSVSLKGLNLLANTISEDADALSELVRQIDPKIKTKEDAEKSVFHLACMIVFSFIKTTSKFTGASELARTYEDVRCECNGAAFRIVDLSIKLDFFEGFPMKDLQELVEECQDNHIAMAAIRSLVKYRLYMRPLDDFRQKQQICDAVGISLQKQLLIEKKAA